MNAPVDSTFQVTRFLRMQPWFARLEAAQQDQLLRHSSTRRADTGEVLLAAHGPAEGWHAVLWGFVKLQIPSADEAPSSFLALSGGEWFGEASVLRDEGRPYEVVALRPTELLCLPRPLVRELAASSLAFNQALLAHMGQRLVQAMAIIEVQRTGTLEQRLGLYLSRAFWHGLRRLHLSQTELGGLAGMSRQAVNRALCGLEQRGLVSLLCGRVASVNHEALEGFLGLVALAPPTLPLQAVRPAAPSAG